MNKKVLNTLIKSKNTTHCYIKKFGCYYRAGSKGYTDYVKDAGVYTKEEALKHYSGCSDLFLVPIDNVKHNEMIANEIQNLALKFIYTP